MVSEPAFRKGLNSIFPFSIKIVVDKKFSFLSVIFSKEYEILWPQAFNSYKITSKDHRFIIAWLSSAYLSQVMICSCFVSFLITDLSRQPINKLATGGARREPIWTPSTCLYIPV